MERSIPAAITTSVSGSAMSAISEKSSDPVVNESLVRSCGEIAWLAGSRTTKSASSSVSQRPAARRRRPASSRSVASGASTAPAVAGVGTGGTDFVSAGTADAPSAQAGIEASADEAVARDRDQQPGGDRGLLPEGVDLEPDQRRGDRLQQQRPERRAVHAAG